MSDIWSYGPLVSYLKFMIDGKIFILIFLKIVLFNILNSPSIASCLMGIISFSLTNYLYQHSQSNKSTESTRRIRGEWGYKRHIT